MNKIKVEMFLSVPTCSGGVGLSRVLSEIAEEYGDQVELITCRGRNDLFEKYGLSAAPAVVIGELIKIMGLCPSKQSLLSALREMGLEQG